MAARPGSAYHYIARIRNKVKHDYASDYWAYLKHGRAKPDAPPNLSYMAAQSVRMQLQAIKDAEDAQDRGNPARWAAGTMAYRKPPVPTYQSNPYSPKTGEKCSCKPGVQRDNCPRCEGSGWVIDFRKIHEKRKENPMRRRRLRKVRGLPGVFGRPAQHYYVKKRRRRNPTRWGNSGRFVRNPGGGGWSTWLLIGGAAAAGLYFFGPQLSSMFGGSSLPAGFTQVGAGMYRGPDGALYARNPQTGAMVKAPTGTQPTDAMDLLTRAGVQMLPAATNQLASWVRGLFNTSQTAAPSATTPRPGATAPTPGGFPTSAIGSALPALPGLISGGSSLLSGGGNVMELPALPAGDAWWDTIGVDDSMGAWWDQPIDSALPWDSSMDTAWWDMPTADVPWDAEAFAPIDDWGMDWGLDSMDWTMPDISYDIPDFDYSFASDVPMDFGFMGLGRRRRNPVFVRRPASFR